LFDFDSVGGQGRSRFRSGVKGPLAGEKRTIVRGPTRLGVITYGAAAGTIDLGDDPPLVVGSKNDRSEASVHRSISWRWLTGTVLTGLTSTALMGAALMAALNNPNQFASLPDAFAQFAAGSADIVFGQKGDRIRPHHEEVASRQIIQVSTVTRQGQRDFIKLRPFAMINATLTFKDDALAKEVPAYDPIRIFADSSGPDRPQPQQGTVASDKLYGANVDGEVSVKVSPFPIDAPDLDPSAAFQTAQVEQILRAATRAAIPQVADPTALMGYAPTDYAGTSGDGTDAGMGVRIVPENVSNVAKSDTGAAGGDGLEDDIIPVTAKTNLTALLKKNGVADDDANQVVSALSQLMDVSHLDPSQKVRIAFSAGAQEGAVARPMRVSIYKDGVHQATIARTDNNVFVRGDEPAPLPTTVADAEPTAPSGGPPTLYNAIYETALEQQVPKPLVDELIRVFAFDVDFQQRVTPGDSMEILHSLPDPSAKDAAPPEVLYASLSLGSAVKKFYRFRTPDDGVVDYYDDAGRSAKKFLIRKPVPVGALTSGFGYRRHPILGRMILHAGVDYAAPSGTPILAAGNGIVEKAGRSSGYGNLIVIKHTNGYETAYGHQSRFAKGIVPGVRVHQGEVIGYVGSTGLSTGPHVHFEIRVNGQPVDPLRIRLPRGRVLQGEYLQAFERERDRIDALLQNAPQGTQKVASSQ
jgi:murein DD-endopeptidase MepM/ murein hydrolase activator NlpD